MHVLICLLTHGLEFLLEVGEVLALGDPEIVIRVLLLGHAVGRVSCADGEDGRRPLRTLRTTDLPHRRQQGGHVLVRLHKIENQLVFTQNT